MLMSCLGFALACVLSSPPADDGAPTQVAHEKYPISVLYAGYPGGERERAFLAFLNEWFTRAAAIDLRKLDRASAADYDVVIADWKSRYKDGKPDDSDPHKKTLEASYDKPTILIGAVAAEITPRTKLDWL
jgi:hypothetical protein